MFEGLGLGTLLTFTLASYSLTLYAGTRLAFLKLPARWSFAPFAGAIIYSFVTPIGMAIGLGTRESTVSVFVTLGLQNSPLIFFVSHYLVNDGWGRFHRGGHLGLDLRGHLAVHVSVVALIVFAVLTINDLLALPSNSSCVPGFSPVPGRH